MNPYPAFGMSCYPTNPINPALVNVKRMSRQKNWERPEETETDKINADPTIKEEKLKDYVFVENIDFVSINTHVRYEVFNTKNNYNKYRFCLGGLLARKDTNFVVLTNGQLSWSVPKITEFNGAKYPTKFYRILTPIEREQKRKEELEVEKDQHQYESLKNLEEIEKQKQEIEHLKKVIYKMSSKQELNADNQSTISNAKRSLGKNVVKNIRN